MSILYFDNTCKEGLTLQEVEEMRDKALRLIDQDMHPRYSVAVANLFFAANALMNEMKLDDSRSFSGSIEAG